MSVYQVEEYYIVLAIEESKKQAVEELLADDGWTDYQYNDGDLIVDCISSEEEAEELEEKINNI